MKIYTIQMSKWRKLPSTIKLVSIVAKEKTSLSPDWKMVEDFKKLTITEQEYVEKYNLLLKNRFSTKEKVLDLINWLKEFKGDIALSCFCSKDSFCHRHLALKFLSDLKEKIIKEKPNFLSEEELNFLKLLSVESELQI